MIDPANERAQFLIDQAARGRLGRRGFLQMAGAAGVGALISAAMAGEALAAGANQRANRAKLKAAYDYVIVGAGAAGCIIAARLAEEGAQVLLLEAGGEDSGKQIDDPSIWFTNIGGPLDWSFPTVPTAALNGRSIPIGAGRVLGGGTSVNASLWVHGFQQDFDNWAYDGCAGWSYADILPIYRALEDWEGGANQWRGAGGPMHVCLPKTPHPTAQAWIEGSRQMGIPILEDMNAPMREGAAYTNMSINRDGSRASASRAYLRPALGRPNLTLLTGTTVAQLRFEGSRCTGVDMIVDGALRPVGAKEVIVCAGGVGSAHLLMLSGLGDPAALAKHDIKARIDLPGVGENFQDHPLLEGVIFGYKGPMPPRAAGSNAVEATSFVRSASAVSCPDLQPVLIQLPVVTPALKKSYGEVGVPGFTIAPGLVRPSGRGWVRLASADYRDKPLIDSGFLSTEADLTATMRCIELCQELGRQKAFTEISSGELIPGRKLSTADLADFARNSATSYFHPVGTCKMGIDALAVVDPQLRVHGAEGLRVCDSSIMPTITTGNTNAPSQMIGAKAAQLILAAA